MSYEKVRVQVPQVVLTTGQGVTEIKRASSKSVVQTDAFVSDPKQGKRSSLARLPRKKSSRSNVTNGDNASRPSAQTGVRSTDDETCKVAVSASSFQSRALPLAPTPPVSIKRRRSSRKASAHRALVLLTSKQTTVEQWVAETIGKSLQLGQDYRHSVLSAFGVLDSQLQAAVAEHSIRTEKGGKLCDLEDLKYRAIVEGSVLLRAMGLDSASLQATGMDATAIDRVFRSLQVYSTGAFQALNESVQHAIPEQTSQRAGEKGLEPKRKSETVLEPKRKSENVLEPKQKRESTPELNRKSNEPVDDGINLHKTESQAETNLQLNLWSVYEVLLLLQGGTTVLLRRNAEQLARASRVNAEETRSLQIAHQEKVEQLRVALDEVVVREATARAELESTERENKQLRVSLDGTTRELDVLKAKYGTIERKYELVVRETETLQQENVALARVIQMHQQDSGEAQDSTPDSVKSEHVKSEYEKERPTDGDHERLLVSNHDGQEPLSSHMSVNNIQGAFDIHHEYENLCRELEAGRKTIETLRSSIANSNQKLAEKAALVEEARLEKVQSNSTRKSLESRVEELKLELFNSNLELEVARRKSCANQSLVEDLHHQMDEKEKIYESVKQLYDESLEAMKQQSAEMEEYKRQSELHDITLSSLRREWKDAESRLRDSEARIDNQRQELKALTGSLKDATSARVLAEKELSQMKAKHDSIVKARVRAEKQSSAFRESANASRKSVENFLLESASLKQAVFDLKLTETELSSKLHDAQCQIEQLQNEQLVLKQAAVSAEETAASKYKDVKEQISTLQDRCQKTSDENNAKAEKLRALEVMNVDLCSRLEETALLLWDACEHPAPSTRPWRDTVCHVCPVQEGCHQCGQVETGMEALRTDVCAFSTSRKEMKEKIIELERKLQSAEIEAQSLYDHIGKVTDELKAAKHSLEVNAGGEHRSSSTRNLNEERRSSSVARLAIDSPHNYPVCSGCFENRMKLKQNKSFSDNSERLVPSRSEEDSRSTSNLVERPTLVDASVGPDDQITFADQCIQVDVASPTVVGGSAEAVLLSANLPGTTLAAEVKERPVHIASLACDAGSMDGNSGGPDETTLVPLSSTSTGLLDNQPQKDGEVNQTPNTLLDNLSQTAVSQTLNALEQTEEERVEVSVSTVLCQRSHSTQTDDVVRVDSATETPDFLGNGEFVCLACTRNNTAQVDKVKQLRALQDKLSLKEQECVTLQLKVSEVESLVATLSVENKKLELAREEMEKRMDKRLSRASITMQRDHPSASRSHKNSFPVLQEQFAQVNDCIDENQGKLQQRITVLEESLMKLDRECARTAKNLKISEHECFRLEELLHVSNESYRQAAETLAALGIAVGADAILRGATTEALPSRRSQTRSFPRSHKQHFTVHDIQEVLPDADRISLAVKSKFHQLQQDNKFNSNQLSLGQW